MELSKSQSSDNSVQSIKKLLGIDDPLDDEIALQVQLISPGRYGVIF